ncbi:metallophosphoesterase [Tunturiibacter lichenicola]|uniref:metallophosphoesterase n=1 Tax=Tunturiibacter lichenicola TaxID=2051959 RepID=UPI003D9BC888
MVLRFLHLSDIHFGQEKDGTLITQDFVRDELTKDVKKLAAHRGPASRVIVTGDVAYSGKSDEYDRATAWLEKLTAACGLGDTHVSTIPGNHDCDLSAISNQAKMLQAQFRLKGPDQVRADLHAIYEDGEAANPFLPKLQQYRTFAGGYGCDFESHRRPFWTRYFDLPGGIRLKFIGLTSVQVSDKDDKPGNIILGNVQYTIAEEDNVVNIVLVHHPLDWFIDKDAAQEHLHNNARVIMVGHEHTLNIQKISDAFSGKEWLVIHAGATNPPDKEYSYQYNWLEFSCLEKNKQPHLVVEIFPRTWVQQKVQFDADRTRLGGAGESVKIEIPCPHLQIIAEPQQADVARSATEERASQSVTPTVQVQGRSTMSNDGGFDRLRYFFWRYLDWRQRLQVLVQVDALPETADEPLPQTMERIALEAAARDGAKLFELWQAVMPLIPEEKRGPNPFAPKKS